MLTYEEFRTKRHIVLDKVNYTFVMNRNKDGIWQTWSIKRIEPKPLISADGGFTMEEAYEFYRERMQSYGFSQFPIIVE